MCTDTDTPFQLMIRVHATWHAASLSPSLFLSRTPFQSFDSLSRSSFDSFRAPRPSSSAQFRPNENWLSGIRATSPSFDTSIVVRAFFPFSRTTTRIFDRNWDRHSGERTDRVEFFLPRNLLTVSPLIVNISGITYIYISPLHKYLWRCYVLCRRCVYDGAKQNINTGVLNRWVTSVKNIFTW